ncbi:MAG TPA: serine/threonine-protein kinase [Pirellula sp.]|nr:serine/threonine-protein kinase [Pirellula sp.]
MNMNVPNKSCDASQIDLLLRSKLNTAEEDKFISHLNSCESCRHAIEKQAAEPETWLEAEKLLKPSSFDLHESSDVAHLTGDGVAKYPHQIQMVLSALGPTDDPDMLGRLGGSEVSGVIGAGGMGVVLKAIDKSLDRVVAIKVLAPYLAASGSARKRFAREAKAAAAVLHSNVIAIHSVSNDEALPYLVMLYLRGSSLQKRLDQQGPLSTIEILRIGSQVAAGLAAAHAQGLVHRDIKPANILLEEGVERVTLTDFGLARAVDDATITHSGVIAGTPQYMSPEQARGEPVEQRSDLFSLGSVLYSISTGRSPFRADTTYGVMRRIADEEPANIREINPDIPDWPFGKCHGHSVSGPSVSARHLLTGRRWIGTLLFKGDLLCHDCRGMNSLTLIRLVSSICAKDASGGLTWPAKMLSQARITSIDASGSDAGWNASPLSSVSMS